MSWVKKMLNTCATCNLKIYANSFLINIFLSLMEFFLHNFTLEDNVKHGNETSNKDIGLVYKHYSTPRVLGTQTNNYFFLLSRRLSVLSDELLNIFF